MLIAVALPWMAALSGYDIRQRRLPNWLTIPGFVVVLAAAAVTGHGGPALAGSVALAAVYLAMHLVNPASMGAGDVKLALALGGLTGCHGADVWTLAAIGAPLLTVAVGLVVRLGWSVTSVPHGPSMCAASAVALELLRA
jgi:leader peptidase (prepilin peptidase) / N-methyltransferase